MKQFRLAAGLLALAMLGACSSEEPIPGGEGNNDGVQGMYLSLNIAGAPTTRATKEDTAEESAINTVQIIVTDATGKEYVNQRIESKDQITDENGTKIKQINGQTVLFAVNNSVFNEMKERADDENWNIWVYANGASTSHNGIRYGSTGNKTWGVANSESDGKNALGFAMSNAEECKGALKAIGTADGLTPNTAWQIKADVKLSRLATRFDYANTNKASYTLTSNNAVKLEIVGIGVNTFANKTFRVAQFSSDGKVPAGAVADGGGTTLCSQFAPTATNKYRVTD
ncbi:MAG: hypothetical protein K2M03_03605, partial [Muribaculaceae bacterium]|nr:hypothetical protein [Muribaculaceae bacterium]